MTQDEIEQSVAGYRAWLEGKPVQYYNKLEETWSCLGKLLTVKVTDKLRPTPQPKLRPWRPEEVPVGAQVRQKVAPVYRMLIASVYADGIYCGAYGCTFGNVLNDWEHSTDNGRTWKPCGVEEVGK